MRAFFDDGGALTEDAVSAYRPGREADISDREALADALSFAAYNGQGEAARFLLDRGADPDLLTPGFLWPGDRGATALHKAVAAGHVDMVRLLLEAGADRSIKDRNNDSSPGNWAGYFGNREIVDLLGED